MVDFFVLPVTKQKMVWEGSGQEAKWCFEEMHIEVEAW